MRALLTLFALSALAFGAYFFWQTVRTFGSRDKRATVRQQIKDAIADVIILWGLGSAVIAPLALLSFLYL